MAIERSEELFEIHRTIWKYFGLIYPKKCRALYFIWIIVFNFVVIFFYPFHLMLGLFKVHTTAEVFKNLTINFSDLLGSVKFLIIWYHLKSIWLIEDTFKALDERIQTIEEKMYFQKVVINCKYIFYVVGFIFASAWVSSELSTFIGAEKRLMYPGWLPIDWEKSSTNYWIANMYQFIGVSLQIIVNYGSDTYPPVCLAVFSGHIRLLAMRLSKLGTDRSKSLNQNNEELKMCIKDHKKLIQLYYALSKILSIGMFFQIICTGFNMCCSIITFVFFTDNLFSKIYCCTVILAMTLQIFPSCYFGSVFETELNNLPYAIFSSNWMDQDRQFKQHLIIFSYRGFQPNSFICMRFFKINLDTFYITMKSAYSLFAVVLQAK